MSNGVTTGGRADLMLIITVETGGGGGAYGGFSETRHTGLTPIWSNGLMVLRVRRKITRFPTSILPTPVDSIHSILYIVWCYELRPWA